MNKRLKNILRPIYRFLRLALSLNYLKTIRMNFGILPFKQAIKLPILVKGKLIIDSLKGKLIFDCPITTGLLLIGGDTDNMPIATNPARIKIIGALVLKGNCFISHSANVAVWEGGTMELGHGVRITSGCLVKAATFVKIGAYTSLASGCFIQDTNAHYIKDTETGKIRRDSYPIEIGKECWITMNSSILGGTKLPDYCIVARNSVLNKDYSGICPPGSMLAGAPAKVVKKNVQRVLDIDKEAMLGEFFRKNPDSEYYIDKPGFDIIDYNNFYFKRWFYN
jgi:acetyltransferase-like isoleucine patch superfamily enzyme